MLDKPYECVIQEHPMSRKPNPKQGMLDLEPRGVRLNVRVTPDEKLMIERVAKMLHTTISEAMRQVIYAGVAKLEKEKREAA